MFPAVLKYYGLPGLATLKYTRNFFGDMKYLSLSDRGPFLLNHTVTEKKTSGMHEFLSWLRCRGDSSVLFAYYVPFTIWSN